jgi:hypothetical protein
VRSFIFAVPLLLAALSAQAREVQSLQPLLLEALHYGQAQGVLVGPIAQTFAQLFRNSAPLVFRVKQVAELTPSCKRLEVTAEQDGVWDRNATQVADRPEARRLVYQVSMCADGSAYTAAPPRADR